MSSPKVIKSGRRYIRVDDVIRVEDRFGSTRFPQVQIELASGHVFDYACTVERMLEFLGWSDVTEIERDERQ